MGWTKCFFFENCSLFSEQTELKHQSSILNQQRTFYLSWMKKKMNMKSNSRQMWIRKRFSRLYKSHWVRKDKNGPSKRLAKILFFWNCFHINHEVPVYIWKTQWKSKFESFKLSSSGPGPGPGRVKVRWGSGKSKKLKIWTWAILYFWNLKVIPSLVELDINTSQACCFPGDLGAAEPDQAGW